MTPPESLGSIAGREVARNRWLRAFYTASRTTSATFIRVAHILWLEITGFLFLSLGIIGAVATAREYQKYIGGNATRTRLAGAAVFTLAFLWFGASSFWKARRKSRR